MTSLFELVCSKPVNIGQINDYFKLHHETAMHELMETEHLTIDQPPIFILACCSNDVDLIDVLIANGADMNCTYVNSITQDPYYHPLIYMAGTPDVIRHVLSKHGKSVRIDKEVFQHLLFNYACFNTELTEVMDILELLISNTSIDIVFDSIHVMFLFNCGQYYLNDVFLCRLNSIHQGILKGYKLNHATDIESSHMFQRYRSVINWWEDIGCLKMLQKYGFDMFTKLNICTYTYDNLQHPHVKHEFDLGRYYLTMLTWEDLLSMSNYLILTNHKYLEHLKLGNPNITAYTFRLTKLCLRMYDNYVRRKYHPQSKNMMMMFNSWHNESICDHQATSILVGIA